MVYILIYILIYTVNIQTAPFIYQFTYQEATRFSIAQWPFIFRLYFSNQIEFGLKSINQEFFLLLKFLKFLIQYFTIEI